MIASAPSQPAPEGALPAATGDAMIAAIIAPTPGPPGPPFDPSALAARFEISLSHLLDFLAAPTTRARIAAALELQDLAFHRRAQSARAKALDHLEKLLDTSEDPVERRRAATAILRPIYLTRPRSSPAGGGGVGTASRRDGGGSPSTPVALLPRPPTPDPSLSPTQSLRRVLARLQQNDNPAPNAGLTTLFNHLSTPGHSSRGWKLADYLAPPGPGPNGGSADARLTNFTTTILEPLQHPLQERPEQAPYHDLKDLARQRVTLTHQGGSELTADFLLTREDHPYGSRPWLITDIEYSEGTSRVSERSTPSSPSIEAIVAHPPSPAFAALNGSPAHHIDSS